MASAWAETLAATHMAHFSNLGYADLLDEMRKHILDSCKPYLTASVLILVGEATAQFVEKQTPENREILKAATEVARKLLASFEGSKT